MAHAAESVETRAPNCKMGKMITEMDFGCLRSYLMILFKQTSTKRHEDPGNKITWDIWASGRIVTQLFGLKSDA
jgi:hypothetical protein